MDLYMEHDGKVYKIVPTKNFECSKNCDLSGTYYVPGGWCGDYNKNGANWCRRMEVFLSSPFAFKEIKDER